MFEVEVQTPLRLRVRIGRLHFRTWRSRFMRLPKRYQGSEMTYAVVEWDEENFVPLYQFGAFFDQKTAEACCAKLEAEGWQDLIVHVLPVHRRLEDWEWDR